jgi:hypothetical protein
MELPMEPLLEPPMDEQRNANRRDIELVSTNRHRHRKITQEQKEISAGCKK